MKLHLFKVITMAIMLSVSGVIASAMSTNLGGTFSMRVEVPFEFQIGDEVFPAGEYEFKQREQYLLAVEKVGSEKDGYALGGSSVEIADGYSDYSLTFHSYGDKTFLRAVSTPSITFTLGKSASESKLQKSSPLQKRIVKY